MDIASSSFSEEDAVFGGGRNLKLGIENVSNAYRPSVIGVATTCLAETIGEDVPQILREYPGIKGSCRTCKAPHPASGFHSKLHWGSLGGISQDRSRHH